MTIENKQITNAQQGFATVLIVLLVGLAVAVSALGTAYYINMSQKSLISSHALTNAQSGAWTGVEILRKYLEVLGEDGISSLNGKDLELNVKDGRKLIVNSITSIEKTANPKQYRVTANIQNISDKSEASSTIQAVYEVAFNSSSSSTGSPGSTITFPSAMNFYGDLDANGGINFSSAGDLAVVNVAGDFKTGSGLTGIKELRVIGDVDISGGGAKGLENIYSNGDVTLKASGNYSLVSAKGSVTTTGSVAVNDIYADGDVEIKSDGNFNSIDTKGSITVNGGTITKATAGNKIISKGVILNALANSDITYSLNNRLDTAKSGGTFTCKNPNDLKGYTKISAVNFASCPTSSSGNLVTLAAGTKVASPTGALVTVSMTQKPLINALDYEQTANYIFSVDDKNKIMVYVRNVDGITEGIYRLGKTKVSSDPSWGYLCKQVDANNFCTSDIVGNFGRKVDNGPEIITYSDGDWKLHDTQHTSSSIASGVLLFKGGTVKLDAGNYANTIISTGDIKYGGSITLKAPNYAGASIVCNSAYFPMPTNLCNSTSTLSSASIGNIALISGSCTDASSLEKCSASYVGGNIKLTGQATIEGSIIAGNALDTGGQTIIKGSILAAALGRDSGSKLSGSTTIDFNGTTDNDTTITLPGSEGVGGEAENPTITQTVKMKWARYI
uniref:hypothetical protein n=1 Tax=Psychrobacter sp. TaxID=56811 RepID=UPI00159AD8A0|nr:hypothetical protein [Psychrobacter sp.]QJS05952.1 hypothetical protein [Psychrobacter sp.]